MLRSSKASSEETSRAVPQAIAPAKAVHLLELPFPKKFLTLKQLRGGALFVVGYLLSPLCWWNDLIFNLPVAYGFGYLCSLISLHWLLPGLIAGYWLSNVVGFVLMQFGAVDAIQKTSQPRNPRKELLMGMASSTLYTLVVLALVQLQILDLNSLLPGELLDGVSLPQIGSQISSQIGEQLVGNPLGELP